ncbi:hypothetical protein MTYP_01121 [Methylophilaceae bacterium]|nr:hypothetical protein MTYP_01121 [Methylophilaceae bacterium]
MQLSKKTCISLAVIGSVFLVNPVMADTGTTKTATAKAAAKKTYTEDEFLNTFSGKSRKVISAQLGQPVRKEQGVRPSGANAAIAQLGQKPGDTSKPVNVEMWYYPDIVRYDAKRTYRQTELTFVNDRVMNITFFNTK